jgi:hypothetical protein
MVTYEFTNGTVADADEVNQNFTDVEQDTGLLGEVRMFALSMTGAITKASLQGKGWAICDGTTPVTQGITSPTIETTPDLQEKFIRMSDDESSGGTGGEATTGTHTHGTRTVEGWPEHESTTAYNGSGGSHSNIPPYYELAYFMKVKN